MCEKYQGWKNFETWGTSLIIVNDQRTCDYLRSMCIEAFNGPVVYDESERIRNAAEAIREELESWFSDYIADQSDDDIMSQIIAQITDFTESTTIDFEEIAKSLIGDEIDWNIYAKECD